jgi:hypothetical protein
MNTSQALNDGLQNLSNMLTMNTTTNTNNNTYTNETQTLEGALHSLDSAASCYNILPPQHLHYHHQYHESPPPPPPPPPPSSEAYHYDPTNPPALSLLPSSPHPPPPPPPSSPFRCITRQDRGLFVAPKLTQTQHTTPPAQWKRLKSEEIHPIVKMWMDTDLGKVNTTLGYICDSEFKTRHGYFEPIVLVKRRVDVPWTKIAELLFKGNRPFCRETVFGLLIFSPNYEKCLWIPWFY